MVVVEALALVCALVASVSTDLTETRFVRGVPDQEASMQRGQVCHIATQPDAGLHLCSQPRACIRAPLGGLDRFLAVLYAGSGISIEVLHLVQGHLGSQMERWA